MIFGYNGDSIHGTYALLINNYVLLISLVLAIVFSPLWEPSSPSPARAGSGGSRPASLHAPSRRALEWPSSPWTKDASLRDSSTRVGDAPTDDAQWKAQWLAALEKEYGGGRPAQPSVSTSVLFDNTGEPVCYAV